MWRITVPAVPQEAGQRGAGAEADAPGRRGLLRRCLFAGVGALSFAGPLQVERFLGAAFDRRSSFRFDVKADDVPQPGAPPRYIDAGRFYLVNLLPGQGGFQAQRGSPLGGVLALKAACPHLGCRLPWRGDWVFDGEQGWFRCPCHGSTFTRAGLRVFGPAPHAMDTFPVTRHRDGSLTVRWKEPKRGDSDDPARTAVDEKAVIGCRFGEAICGPSIEEH